MVRRTQIEFADLNVFEFDYDLTFMVFLMNADEHIYGRYGSRDEHGPETRMSLAGLNYAMQAALAAHQSHTPKSSASDPERPPRTIRQYESARFYHNCIHCHQVKEILRSEAEKAGKWKREMIWRYPLPDNLGLTLEIDRGNVVESVAPDSPTADAGLQPGDVLQSVNGHPVHSIADVQFALDKAFTDKQLKVQWHREGRLMDAAVELPDGWRRSPITWRTSMLDLMPSAKLYGRDLSEEEKVALGLEKNQLAFAHRDRVLPQAEAAGIRPGDVIVGVDGRTFTDTSAYQFRLFIQRNFIVGDRVAVNVLRNGKPVEIPMTLGE